MGCCLSKKDPCSKPPTSLPQTQKIVVQKLDNNVTAQVGVEKKRVEGNVVVAEKDERYEKRENEEKMGSSVVNNSKKKAEVFAIHHRKSSDKISGSGPDADGSVSNGMEEESVGRNLIAAATSGQVVRTSSCTKEEVDAILIQCGRLSRSSSGNAGNGRRYSGSKRSFDFDKENEGCGNEEEGDGKEGRLRRRESRGSESNRRRATPSRSRERVEQQRSGSRERNSSGRRVSRSPGRRSESPLSQHHGNGNGNNSVSSGNGNGNGNGRPGKLVSVPATVTSLSVDKGGGENGNVKRVLVKRNVGSPRCQSPARGNQPTNARSQSPSKGTQVPGNGGSQQQCSLSRNGSRKADQSPYRRTPLNEIDINSLPFQPLSNNRLPLKVKQFEDDVVLLNHPINIASQSKYAAEIISGKTAVEGSHRRTRSRGAEGYEVTKTNYCRVGELETQIREPFEAKRDELNVVEYDAMVTPVVVSGTDTLRMPQTLMRTRSARRSRDLDINVDALLSPVPARDYNSLLLQDIQNFHQKKGSNGNSNCNTVTSNSKASTPFALPTCLSKACSIVEAVADLNSTTGSNLSFPFTDDRKVSPKSADANLTFHSSTKRVDSRDPFVESEVKVGDDLMEPSFHKYVTVRKRGEYMDDEESSGSNSIAVCGQHSWVSSSTWEPNSAESTDCWTSKSYTLEDGSSPAGFQRHAISNFTCNIDKESGLKFGDSQKELLSAQQQLVGAARSKTGPKTASKLAAASM